MGFNSGFKGLIEQHSKFLLHTLQVFYMCTLCDSTNINTIIQFVPHKRGTQNEKIKWREEKCTWRSVIFMYIPCIFIVCYLFVPTNAHIYIYILYTGLFKMIVWVLTTCHTQYTSDSSICIFLFNRTTLQVFVTYLTGALYVHHLWFYKHQHDNRVRSKLFVACQL